jgi:hypothetical protein
MLVMVAVGGAGGALPGAKSLLAFYGDAATAAPGVPTDFVEGMGWSHGAERGVGRRVSGEWHCPADQYGTTSHDGSRMKDETIKTPGGRQAGQIP